MHVGQNHYNHLIMIVTSDNGQRRVKVLPSWIVFVGLRFWVKVSLGGDFLFCWRSCFLSVEKSSSFREANIEVWNGFFTPWNRKLETVGGFCQGIIALILEMGFARFNFWVQLWVQLLIAAANKQIYFLSQSQAASIKICLSVSYNSPCNDNIYRIIS